MILLLALMSCVEAPEPCLDMCAQAAAVQCGCLEVWGSEWSDIGMQSQQDFYARCQTWAWQMALLEKDARSRGTLEEAGTLEAVCEERTEVLEDPALSCEEWSAIDWSVTPWD